LEGKRGENKENLSPLKFGSSGEKCFLCGKHSDYAVPLPLLFDERWGRRQRWEGKEEPTLFSSPPCALLGLMQDTGALSSTEQDF